MPATAKNLRLDGRVLGSGLLWGGLPVPVPGSKLVLAAADADGLITPDSVANPNAYPIGATKDGVVCSGKATRTKHYVHEVPGQVDSTLEQVMMSIQANLHAINDPVVQKLIGAGFLSQTVSSTDVQNTVGFAQDVFTGIALIAPMREDPTKVFVFHIYKAINEAGFEFSMRKNELGSTPVNFEAYSLPNRPLTDQMGNWWFTKA